MLLEQVLGQIVFEHFALNLEVFSKYRYDAIFCTFSISAYRYKAQELLLSKRFEIMEKLHSSKASLKKVPHLDPPLTHLVTVGTEIAAPHKQQVTVSSSSAAAF